MNTKINSTTRQAKTTRPMWASLFLVGAVGLAINAATSASQQDEDLETTRTALEQWVETRQLISQEKRDWVEGKQLLEDRIALIQRETEALRKRMSEANESIAQADTKRAQLVAENESRTDLSNSLKEVLVGMEARTKALITRMPDPVRERVESLSQRIPTDPETTKQGLSDRYLNIVGILNEVGRFNREITLSSEVRELPNGTQAEVAVMYVGLGHAYYVTNNGESAGVGTSSEEGWVWTPADESAANITRAIAILRGEEIAEYVQLPIEISRKRRGEKR